MRTAEECLAWLMRHHAMCYPVWQAVCVSVAGYEYVNAPTLDEAISAMERQMSVVETIVQPLLAEKREA